jgi:hypothetical protein
MTGFFTLLSLLGYLYGYYLYRQNKPLEGLFIVVFSYCFIEAVSYFWWSLNK